HEAINGGAKPTAWDTGTAHATGTSHHTWSNKNKAKDTLGTAGWVQTTGTTTAKNTSSATTTSHASGGYGYTTHGGNVQGTWSEHGHAKGKDTFHTDGTCTPAGWTYTGSSTKTASGGG